MVFILQSLVVCVFSADVQEPDTIKMQPTPRPSPATMEWTKEDLEEFSQRSEQKRSIGKKKRESKAKRKRESRRKKYANLSRKQRKELEAAWDAEDAENDEEMTEEERLLNEELAMRAKRNQKSTRNHDKEICEEHESNAHWIDDAHNGAGGCFCNKGFWPASLKFNVLSCVRPYVARREYCREDPNSDWDEEEDDCFCNLGYEASHSDHDDGDTAPGHPVHGHPCKWSGKVHLGEGLESREACRHAHSNAEWVVNENGVGECYCKEGYMPFSYHQPHALPCRPIEEIDEAYCDEDPHATWYIDTCVCNHPYVANSRHDSSQLGHSHPCVLPIEVKKHECDKDLFSVWKPAQGLCECKPGYKPNPIKGKFGLSLPCVSKREKYHTGHYDHYGRRVKAEL